MGLIREGLYVAVLTAAIMFMITLAAERAPKSSWFMTLLGFTSALLAVFVRWVCRSIAVWWSRER